jgi:carbonic anhydrase/acetyltransferase-like protein (isoleucine patch superfamily)
MGLILPVKGISPSLGEENWVAPNATIVGDVRTGNHCTIWFNAVVRGDVNAISIGNYTNIQDGAVIHCTFEKTVTTIGDYVSIAHNAIVHGCTIEDNVLIGMGAIVMDNAYIESGSIVPAGTIYAGNPAKYLKEVSPDAAEVFKRTAYNYVEYASWFSNPSI